MLLALVELDRMVDQVRVEILDLLLRELDVVEPSHDLVVREEPLLDPLLDQALKLLDLWEGDIDRQHGRAFSSRARTDTDLAPHTEPARLPPRLHHQSARILVRKRQLWKGSGWLTCAELADDLAARVLDRDVRELSRLESEPREERAERAAKRALRAVLDLERDPEA